MKKLIFVLLKIAEISLVPITYCFFTYVGWFLMASLRLYLHGEAFVENPHNFGFLLFAFGALCSFLAFAIFKVISLTWELIPDLFNGWISANKDWSENISKWLKSRFS